MKEIEFDVETAYFDFNIFANKLLFIIEGDKEYLAVLDTEDPDYFYCLYPPHRGIVLQENVSHVYELGKLSVLESVLKTASKIYNTLYK